MPSTEIYDSNQKKIATVSFYALSHSETSTSVDYVYSIRYNGKQHRKETGTITKKASESIEELQHRICKKIHIF